MQIVASEPVKADGRLGWVDNAKGIGIILVLLGHTPIPVAYKLFIYAFHMPLFFFIGGLFLNVKKSPDVFLKDKVRRLLLPYLIFAIASYLIWLSIRNYSAIASGIPAEMPLLGIFYGIGSGNWMPENTPLWFLPCMFSTVCLLYLLVHLPKKLAFITILICSVIGYNLPQWLYFRLPLSIDLAMLCMIFTAAGYYFRNYWLNSPPLSWLATSGFMTIWLLAAWFNSGMLNPIHMIDINNGIFNNYFLFVIAAISGTIVTVNVAKRILSFPLLAYVGKNSIGILGLHMLIYLTITVIFTKLLHFPLTLTYERLSRINPHAHPLLAMLSYLVPGILLPLLLMKLYRTLKATALKTS